MLASVFAPINQCSSIPLVVEPYRKMNREKRLPYSTLGVHKTHNATHEPKTTMQHATSQDGKFASVQPRTRACVLAFKTGKKSLANRRRQQLTGMAQLNIDCRVAHGSISPQGNHKEGARKNGALATAEGFSIVSFHG